MGKRVTVTDENGDGRNLQFHDNVTGATMSRAEFVQRIEGGAYPNYHIRVVNGIKTRCPILIPPKTIILGKIFGQLVISTGVLLLQREARRDMVFTNFRIVALRLCLISSAS